MNRPSGVPFDDTSPPGVGPASSEHRAVCLYTGLTPDGPQCSDPATIHVLSDCEEYGVVALASCDKHVGTARAAGAWLDEHAHAGVCGLPGTVWLGPPESRCAIGLEPQLTGVVQQEVERV